MNQKIVIDTNIIFSILLSKNSHFLSMLFDDNYNMLAPNFLFVEIFNKKEKIIKHSKLNDDEIVELLSLILSKIHFVKDEIISINSKQIAYHLCKDIDLKDIPFVALAIEFNCKIWTGDKKLINGLEIKGFNDFLK